MHGNEILEFYKFFNNYYQVLIIWRIFKIFGSQEGEYRPTSYWIQRHAVKLSN